jgi:SAM-dependent methyltransferase
MADDIEDVPSSIDLRSRKDARAWVSTAMAKRPWRAEFFVRIAEALAGLGATQPAILELGSGPGCLAEQLLPAFPGSIYTALDFSPAMHQIAKERLGVMANRIVFIERDFRAPDWSLGLPMVDAVVTMQAVHELRHKRHAWSFYQAIRRLLKPGGMLLACDHFAGEDGMSDSSLFMTRDEHAAAIRDGGFTDIDVLMIKGGLILFRALV